MITVAYILGALNRGGAETLILDIFKTGHRDINFICIYRKDGNFSEEFINCGIQTTKIAPNGKFDLLYIFRLRRILKNNKVDIIHSHQLIDGVVGLLVSCFSKRKAVMTFHGHELHKSFFMNVLRKIVLKLNTLNIFVSNSQLNFFKINNKINFHYQVLYNGINFEKFSQTNNLRDDLGIKQDMLLTVSVGNFTSVRNHFFICEFLKWLIDTGVKFAHIFIGAKSDAEPQLYDNCVKYCIENNLSENVFFLGRRNDVPDLLSQTNAFLYATKHDSFGIAVIEAISAKLPVFVNNTDVMLEISENGELANIYESDNIEGLLQIFKNYLINKEIYIERATKASEVVKNKYSIQQHLQNLFEIYRKI